MKSFAALASALFWGSPALADDYVSFQSPTGNIHCAIFAWDNTSEARCDLVELVPSYTKSPPGCELDWGFAFTVGKAGKATLGCVGDTMVDPGNTVLPYGEAVSYGGISCVSAKTGVTCTNAEGHGFSVAKAKQRLY